MLMTRLLLVLGVLVMLASPVPVDAQARRVAVLDFANSAKDPAVEWLGPAVAATLTTKLHAVRSLHLVERLQLYKVLQEQKLNMTDLVDPTQAVKVGKLLGAEQVAMGEYAVFGGTVRFTARFVDATTASIVATSQVNGTLDPSNANALWAALDQLAEATIASLNTRVAIVQGVPQPGQVEVARRIEPTPEERVKLTKPPARSLEALAALGRGLDAYRRHAWPEAAREFEAA